MERDAATAMGANLKAAAEALPKGQPAPTPRPPVIVPPAAMTGDRQVIDVGGIEVQVLFLGRAHTGGDLHVLLPKQRILFMSEAYLNRVFPAMRSAYPDRVGRDHRQGAGAAGRPLRARPRLHRGADGLARGAGGVPGRAAGGDRRDAAAARASGLRADAAVKQANWGPYAEWFLADQQAPIAVAKIYEEIEGTLK